MKKHPHVRGEDPLPQSLYQSLWETPPRAWGRRQVARNWRVASGNTPTCVGKTMNLCHLLPLLQKHPHVRGEDSKGCFIQSRGRETPPRAWGRLWQSALMKTTRGNTPTCVGKTVSPPLPEPLSRKHPHVRGEDVKTTGKRASYGETPPRAWGRRAFRLTSSNKPGNTPTCVGKTLCLKLPSFLD